jgi:hypothetical protein
MHETVLLLFAPKCFGHFVRLQGNIPKRTQLKWPKVAKYEENKKRLAVRRVRRLVAGPVPQTPTFDTRLVLVSPVVDEVAQGLGFPRALCFTRVRYNFTNAPYS